MNKPISWEAGRAYSGMGQRIYAKILEDGRIAFCDTARRITGIIKLSEVLVDNVETHVMHCYDQGHYDALSFHDWAEMTKSKELK